jgi:hypothetical protein
MESELFMELSEEQQELVAGGVDFSTSLTNFKAKSIDIESASTSGPEGSTAVGVGDSVKIDTFGANLVSLNGSENGSDYPSYSY